MTQPFYDTQSFKPCSSIGYLLRRSSVLLADLTEQIFREQGLSFTSWLFLEILRHNAPMSLLELSQYAGFDPATVSRAVEQLNTAGLVTRERSTVDRRAVVLSLTAQGLETLREQTPLVLASLNGVMAELSPEDAAALVALLSRFLGIVTAAVERRKNSGRSSSESSESSPNGARE